MGNVEIRTYEGDGSDLAELTGRAWRQMLGGKTWFPVPDRDYFHWRYLDERGGGRDFLVAAYDGTRLVGCMLGEPFEFEVRGERAPATMSSWLTVDPEIKGPRLALRMASELRRRHHDQGMAFSMGWTSSVPDSIPRQFWSALAKMPPKDLHFLGRTRFWVRVLDAETVSGAALNSFERWGPRAAGMIPWGWVGRRQSPHVRDYRRDDAARCLAWIEDQGRSADIRIVWSQPRLELQLGHAFARTLVLDRGDAGGGFINYHPLAMVGAKPIRTAIIALLAGDVGLSGQVDLLRAAGDQMVKDGIHQVMMMESAASPTRALLAAGFLPYDPHADHFWYFTDPGLMNLCPLGGNPPVRHHVIFG